MRAQMADLRSPPQSRSGLFLFFGLILVCLSPLHEGGFVEEDSTARWVGLESPSRPAVALSFFVVMLVVINHQKYILPTHHSDDSCRSAC